MKMFSNYVYECVFSQDEVREAMVDRSLFSNFILELSDGNKKLCGILNEIQMCFFETLQWDDNREHIFTRSLDLKISRVPLFDAQL